MGCDYVSDNLWVDIIYEREEGTEGGSRRERERERERERKREKSTYRKCILKLFLGTQERCMGTRKQYFFNAIC